MGGVKGLL